jgi:Fe-S cluster assembly iron-binding protein IscA
MLELTEGAMGVIRGIVEMESADGAAGLRITTEEMDGEEAELNLAVAEGPEEGDETVERDGVRVYLSAPASLLLSDKVLDAHEHDDHVHFEINEQGAPPNGHVHEH